MDMTVSTADKSLRLEQLVEIDPLKGRTMKTNLIPTSLLALALMALAPAHAFAQDVGGLGMMLDLLDLVVADASVPSATESR
jgi:hypothetical protein